MHQYRNGGQLMHAYNLTPSILQKVPEACNFLNHTESLVLVSKLRCRHLIDPHNESKLDEIKYIQSQQPCYS